MCMYACACNIENAHTDWSRNPESGTCVFPEFPNDITQSRIAHISKLQYMYSVHTVHDEATL